MAARGELVFDVRVAQRQRDDGGLYALEETEDGFGADAMAGNSPRVVVIQEIRASERTCGGFRHEQPKFILFHAVCPIRPDHFDSASRRRGAI